MEGATPIACPVQLSGSIGGLRSGAVSAFVDAARPDLGLSRVFVGKALLPGPLFCVEREPDVESAPSQTTNLAAAWPLSVNEVYVRDSDLVASYNAVEDWPYSPQIYWSSGALDAVDGVIGSFSLLVSVQTHLLDTRPRIAAESRFRCDEIWQLKDGGDGDGSAEQLAPGAAIHCRGRYCCIVRRWNDEPVSYAEIMMANDFRDVAFIRDAPSDECRLKWTLFSEFMEKGVIRRARLVGVFLPRENDVELAANCCEALERAPLPLTV
jgi:hypothetical protein